MNKHSRVCANIDLSAVMHNMEAMHQNIDPDTKIMAVIKADGYGHGAVPIAKEIEHLDYVYGYAAATVEEGMILRNNGIQKPILILGYIFPDQYEEVIQAEICPSVFTLDLRRCGYSSWKSFLLLPKKLEKTAGCILQWIPE